MTGPDLVREDASVRERSERWGRPVDLSKIDLSLMVALDALLAERSVTRAARRTGMTQPGMSNALARLRKLFGDGTLDRLGGRK
jgi:Transcriptional regulator